MKKKKHNAHDQIFMTNKVTPEIQTDSDSLSRETLSPDELPSYEDAIQMPADYIKSPSDENIVIETTGSSRNCEVENGFFAENRISKSNIRHKLLITFIILAISGLMLLFLLIF